MTRIAISPVTWGVDFADAPNNPPWEKVLDEIEQSGVGALELGPVGYLPEEPERLRDILSSRSLTSVGSFIFDDLHDPSQADRILTLAERASLAIAASGGGVLVIIDRPDDVRVRTAGRSAVAPRLDDDRWRSMLDQITRVSDVAHRHGLRPVVHPHAGGYIEFEDEVERLVEDMDVDLCIDTGHFAYARIDPVAAIERYAGRIGHMHLKDIRPDVLARVDAEGLSFWEAIEAGIFCPLGEGLVDLSAVLDALDAAHFDGYATIEQDRVPGTGEALDDVRQSLAVLAHVSRG